MPDFHLAVPPEAQPWRRSLFLRGIDHLPITVPSAARAAA
jgi:hypothetical protein